MVQGTRARKPIKLPLPGALVNGENGEWEGPTAVLDLRVLRDDELTLILREARAFAKANGLDAPEDGDALYEQGKMLHTLAVCCIDHDSPKESPIPYFDGGWEQIHTSEILTPEIREYLYLQQQMWQDEVNPLLGTLSDSEFLAAAIKTAGGNQSFFVNSRPGWLWSFTRIMARQLLASRSLSSAYSTFSPQPPETRSSEESSPRTPVKTTRKKGRR